MNDTRYGRFFTVDPLRDKYPYYTPYAFAGNTPIQAIDLDGLEPATPPKYNGDYENAIDQFTNDSRIWYGQVGQDGSATWSDEGKSLPEITITASKPLMIKTQLAMENAASYLSEPLAAMDKKMKSYKQVGAGVEFKAEFNKYSFGAELGSFSTSETNGGIEGKLKYSLGADLGRELGGDLSSNLSKYTPSVKFGLYFYGQKKNSYKIGKDGEVLSGSGFKNVNVGEAKLSLGPVEYSNDTNEKHKVSIGFSYKFDTKKNSSKLDLKGLQGKLGIKNETQFFYNSSTKELK